MKEKINNMMLDNLTTEQLIRVANLQEEKN